MYQIAIEILISFVLILPYVIFLWWLEKRAILRAEKKLGFPLVKGGEFLEKYPQQKMTGRERRSMHGTWFPDRKGWTAKESLAARKASLKYRLFIYLISAPVIVVWILVLSRLFSES